MPARDVFLLSENWTEEGRRLCKQLNRFPFVLDKKFTGEYNIKERGDNHDYKC